MPSEPIDADLAARAAQGDKDAMAELLDRHYDYVDSVCRRIVRDPGRAEDARQETFMSAARGIRGFKNQCAFRTWLHTIARNTSLNIIRSDRRVPYPVGDSILDAPAQNAYFTRGVEARFDIDQALGRMTPEFRDAVVLRYLCDLPYDDVGQMLEIPIGTVRSRIHRGLAELQQILGNVAEANSV